jgi:hypothetical protein
MTALTEFFRRLGGIGDLHQSVFLGQGALQKISDADLVINYQNRNAAP